MEVKPPAEVKPPEEVKPPADVEPPRDVEPPADVELLAVLDEQDTPEIASAATESARRHRVGVMRFSSIRCRNSESLLSERVVG